MNNNLLTKRAKQLKEYNTPNIEFNNLQSNDILNASMFGPDEMYYNFLHKVADNNAQNSENKDAKNKTVKEKYPNGLPVHVLKQIDYKKFGAMLKQNRLLPPSYDKSPIKIDIDENYEKTRVLLTFKSKTSNSVRTVSVYGYTVAYSTKINEPITILEVNPMMSKLWKDFAEYVMDYWDSSFRFEVMKKDL